MRLAGLGAKGGGLDADLRSHEAFAREGATSTAADAIRAAGGEALEHEADVGDPAAVQAAIDAVLDTWGRIDVVVCNAGGGTGALTESMASTLNLDDFETVLDRNLRGTVHTCIAVAPAMKAAARGKIVTVSSQAGLRASTDGTYAHYGAAKAGIIMYSRYLAQDLGPHGITVNCIAPGYIGTGRLMEGFEKIGVEKIERLTALRRIGTVEDCARVVEFLATDLSDYVTGAVITIDGGSTTG